MKILVLFLDLIMTLIVTLLPSMGVMAHEDNFLGDGFVHNFFHMVMTTVAIVVLVKVTLWLKKRQRKQ